MKKKIIIILILIVLTITLVAIPKSTYQKLFGNNKIDDSINNVYENHQVVYVINSEQKLVGLKVGVSEIEDDQIVQKWNLLTKESSNLPAGYVSPINQNSIMIDYQINNNILTLNLSEEFLNSNGKMAISSLAWTFCDEEIKEVVVLINGVVLSKLNDYEFKRINKEICVNYEFESMFVYETISTTVIHYYDDYLVPVTYFHKTSDQCDFIVSKILDNSIVNDEKYDYKLENDLLVINLGITELLSSNELSSLVESIEYNLKVSNLVINGIESVIYKSDSVEEL